ncbi:MAG: tryptophan-rich sensory protein [Candidatus Omnitrophica bacterium]|nr:tryptophan-rich sensory protein [Candidatus Omnitrophota bacterium]
MKTIVKICPRDWLALLGWVGLSLSAGVAGSQFEPGLWYELLRKPFWTPPSVVFPLVWSVLYVLMGLAVWRLWRTPRSKDRQLGLGLFLAQLVLNAMWSWLFFGEHAISLALIEIVLLQLSILACVIVFCRTELVAGLLMLPYLLWVSFAVILNGGFWWLNRTG